MKYIATIVVTLCLFSCSKKSISTCTNTNAVNYGKAGSCTYPSNILLQNPGYRVKVVEYPLDPSQVGMEFGLTVMTSECTNYPTDSFYEYVTLNFTNSLFYPSNFCIELNGFNFTMPNSVGTATWSGAPLSGNGQFSNGTFIFTGSVLSHSGYSPIVIQSF